MVNMSWHESLEPLQPASVPFTVVDMRHISQALQWIDSKHSMICLGHATKYDDDMPWGYKTFILGFGILIQSSSCNRAHRLSQEPHQQLYLFLGTTIGHLPHSLFLQYKYTCKYSRISFPPGDSNFTCDMSANAVASGSGHRQNARPEGRNDASRRASILVGGTRRPVAVPMMVSVSHVLAHP